MESVAQAAFPATQLKIYIHFSELISFCALCFYQLSHSGFKALDCGLEMTNVFMEDIHLVIKRQLELWSPAGVL